jgi:hypothetical protein
VTHNGEKLSEERYLTLMLRLLADRSGTRVQGEVLDVTTKSKRKFLGWQALVRAVRELAEEQPTDES